MGSYIRLMLAAALVASLSATVHADEDVFTRMWVDGDWDRLVDTSTDAVVIDSNYPPTMQTLSDDLATEVPETAWSNYVNAFQQQVRAYVAASADDDSPVSDYTDMQQASQFQNRVTVTAGESGLSQGEPVTLETTFSFSGISRLSGGTSGDGDWWNRTYMSPQISIRDADADEDHLFYQAIVMSDRWYDAEDGEHFAYHFVEDGMFGNMTIEEEIFQEWDADGQDWLATTEFGVEIEPITIELETYVGAELEVWGYLNSEAFSDGQGWAAADNLNSLASELRPAEGFESVSLDYALVPEPTSGALLLLGLAAVAARRRGSRLRGIGER